MFRTITAKYPDTCKRCHCDIHPGDRIRYGGPGRIYHLKADCQLDGDRQNPKPEWGSQEWAETRGDDLGPSPDF
jgi:hypothetical protein